MKESILFLDFLHYGPGFLERCLDDLRHRSVFQILPAAVGEFHQILVVLVSSSLHHGVTQTQIQFPDHPFQKVLRHVGIVDDSQCLAFFSGLESFGYFLQDAASLVVIYLHFGISGELECIGFE